MLPPSNLPSGAALKNCAVRALCDCVPLQRRWREIGRNRRYKSITPEILFQRFYACLGEATFLAFFHLLRHARPNSAHQLLGELCEKRMCRIVTTNFDLLVDRQARSRSIIHLHGALDRADTMVTRINQVGRGLTGKLRNNIRRQLSGSTLCVLGYSGADNDVWTAVQSSRVDRILWLVRKTNDPTWQNLPRFGRKHRIQVAVGDMRGLFRKLGKAAFRNDVEVKSEEAARRRLNKMWLRPARLIDRYACLSEVFFEIEDYKAAAEISEEAFPTAHGTELSGWFHIQAAEAHKILGNFRRAAHFGRKAIRLNKRIGDPFDIAGSYNIYGLIQAEKTKPNLHAAKQALRKAISTIETIDLATCTRHRREGVRNFHARALNNLGLALSHSRKITLAVTTYRKSLWIKQKLGDLLGVAVTSGNISIAYLRGGRLQLAKKWRARALELMDKYQLGFQKAYLLRQTGVLICEHGDLITGRSYLQRALEVYIDLGQTAFGQALTEKALKRYALPKSKRNRRSA